MRLKIVHTKNGKTLYKDLDTGHWVPKNKAEDFIKKNKISDVREPQKEEQIRKAQEQAKALNEQHTDPYKMNFKELPPPGGGWRVFKDQQSGWTVSAKQYFMLNEKKLKGQLGTRMTIRDENGKAIGNSFSFPGVDFDDENKNKFNESLQTVFKEAETSYGRRSDPEPYKDILGPQEKNADPIERLTKCKREYIINNKYRDSKEEYYKYHKNCALCTTAGVLQARGYDVEAMPRDKNHWRGSGHVFDVDYSNTDNYIIGDSTHWSTGSPRYDKASGKVTFKKDKNDTLKTFTTDKEPQFMPKGAKAAAEAITEKVKGWGNGAVGELSVCWKDTNKWHSIMISNDHGSIFIFDAQDNTVTTEIEHFLKDTFAKRTTLVRLDNAPLRQDCQSDLKKMVKPIDRSFGAAMKRLDNIPWEKIM